MTFFERYLTLWIGLCMVGGVALGALWPAPLQAIGGMNVAQINLPIAGLVWLMIVPMLLRIDPAALRRVGQHWRGIVVTLGVNWLVKPFSMALLAWVFIGWLFRPLLPGAQIESYIAGLILLAAAPCTAMVFVWADLVGGDAEFTLSQIALNDTIMLVAFAPIVGLLLGVSAIAVPWATLVLAVVVFILVPLTIAQAWRISLVAAGALDRVRRRLGHLSMGALLAMLVLLFGLQGRQIIDQPLVIVLLAAPILIQVYLNAGLALALNRGWGEVFAVAAPSALIGASNFFELAVATAIALFGFDSGAALATVVGALVEVPVMLSVVALARRLRPGWPSRGGPGVSRAASARRR